MPRLLHALRTTAILVLLAACGDDTLAPFQPEVATPVDNFQFQVTALSNVSATVEYSWQNTGTSANVNQSTSLASGTATVTIRDAAGAVVYTRSLAENGTFQTSVGQAGTWRIRVAMDRAYGAVNFRVQKR